MKKSRGIIDRGKLKRRQPPEGLGGGWPIKLNILRVEQSASLVVIRTDWSPPIFRPGLEKNLAGGLEGRISPHKSVNIVLETNNINHSQKAFDCTSTDCPGSSRGFPGAPEGSIPLFLESRNSKGNCSIRDGGTNKKFIIDESQRVHFATVNLVVRVPKILSSGPQSFSRPRKPRKGGQHKQN